MRVGGHGNGKSKVDRRHNTDETLPAELFAGTHPLRVVMHNLSVVIDPADCAVSERHKKNGPDKTVGEVHPQKCRKPDCHQNERAPHRGRSVLHQMRFGPAVSHGLTDLEFFEFTDHPGPGRKTDCQSRERGKHCS